MDLEATAQSKGYFPVPERLQMAYFITKLHWTEEQYLNASHTLIEEINLIWHLENEAGKHKP